jgi:hypothetical protein
MNSAMAQSAGPPRPAWIRVLAVLAAAAALGWVALVNGQPFFHPDTIGYVRGPDVAVMKLAGPRFATEWAKFDPGAVGQHLATPAAGPHAASYNDTEVLAGRSIYYGVLAYLGALAGGFWLTVFVQGLAVAWLAEIILRALNIASLRAYAAVIAILALATPAPFFVAFLMPDIWAGVAIGAAATLFALPARLQRLDIAAVAAMTAFAALAHSSVVPVLLALMLAGGGWWLVRRRIAPDPRAGLAVLGLAVVVAVAGNVAFAKMVEHTAGRPPVMPPFLSARVIADGTGTRFVRERCAGAFMVCRFAGRFPMSVDDFLWAQRDKGVFESASADERRALGAEQTRFALAVVKAYPVPQVVASARNAVLQTLDTDLSDFNYKPSLRASLSARMPPAQAAALRGSLAWREAWPLGPVWALQSAVTLAALVAAGWLASRPRPAGAAAETGPAVLLFGLVLVGVLANGVVCGVLSTLYGRYEARVVWTLPLAACALALVASPLRRAMSERTLQPARA